MAATCSTYNSMHTETAVSQSTHLTMLTTFVGSPFWILFLLVSHIRSFAFPNTKLKRPLALAEREREGGTETEREGEAILLLLQVIKITVLSLNFYFYYCCYYAYCCCYWDWDCLCFGNMYYNRSCQYLANKGF